MDYKVLIKVFKDDTLRTKYYKDELFPKIALDLELNYLSDDYQGLDAVFCKKNKIFTNDLNIPIVFIKSANDVASIHYVKKGSELLKMCSLNAPLKILFTTAKDFFFGKHIFDEWQEDNSIYNHVAQLNQCNCLLHACGCLLHAGNCLLHTGD